jgi:hypothetical protein
LDWNALQFRQAGTPSCLTSDQSFPRAAGDM